MTTYRAENAECLIFTYKEGLLSKVAHDLKLRVNEFQVHWKAEEVIAEFDPRSIEVVNAMKNGQENPSALTASDKAKVLENMHRDVLKTKKFPTIRFSAGSLNTTDTRVEVDGYLELVGKKRPVRAIALQQGAHWDVQVPLHQPDFGIKPFKALMGAIKIKPDVMIRIRLPVEGA